MLPVTELLKTGKGFLRMVKRILAGVICLMLAILPAAPGGAVAETIVYIDSAAGSVGEEVQIFLRIENPVNMAGGELELVYDSELVEPVKVSAGSLIQGFLFLSNTKFSANSIKMAWAGTQGKSTSGNIAVITFSLKKPGTADLKIGSFKLVDVNNKVIHAAMSDGSITVAGDAEEDGVIPGSGAGSGIVPGPVTFTDIQGHWAQKDVELMVTKNVLKGVSADLFDPEREVTRAEFATMLVRALGLQTISPAQGTFADVSQNDWYYTSIETAYAAGLVKGDGESFMPLAQISRQEMAVMIVRALQASGQATSPAAGEEDQLLAKFTDTGQLSSWARTEMAMAVKSGIITGLPNNMMAPLSYAKRSEAATIVKRMMEKADLL